MKTSNLISLFISLSATLIGLRIGSILSVAFGLFAIMLSVGVIVFDEKNKWG